MIQKFNSIETSIKDFYSGIDDILSETFNTEFNKILNKNNINIKFEFSNDSIDLNWSIDNNLKKDNFILEIKSMEDELKKKNNYLSILNENTVRNDLFNAQKYIKNLKNDHNKNISIFNSRQSALGPRPRPKQKYRETKKTIEILFWKKTEIIKVPDELDDSNGLKWDKDIQNIRKEFDNKERNIDSENKKYRKILTDCRNKLYEIDALKKDIEELDYIIKDSIIKANKNKKLKNDREIERIKGDVLEFLKKYTSKSILSLIDDIDVYFNKKDSDIKSSIDIKCNDYINQYEVKSEQKLNEIRNKIKESDIDKENIIKSISELKYYIEKGEI
ncbi:MAG: hypothetical protein R3Y64_11195 [Peptostreptococcaceae bacterium]